MDKKTKAIYRHLAIAVDSTKSREGTLMVVYCPDDNEHSIYVQEQSEFEENFDILLKAEGN